MNIPVQLRLYNDYIRAAGIVRFEQPNRTVYAAPSKNLLLQQRKAMELLRHLEVAPLPSQIYRLRGLWVMPASHQTLTDILPVWQEQDREGRIEFIRRLGATMGMLHSLRHPGAGDILCPEPRTVAADITALLRKSSLLCGKDSRERFPQILPGLMSSIKDLWVDSGGTLVGNWQGFPPVKIWEDGLMIMGLSGARYSEPLLDLVNIHPQAIGLEDTGFFWEYFLQGYGATGELSANWQEKIEILYRIRILQAAASGTGEKWALEDWQSKWWEKI